MRLGNEDRKKLIAAGVLGFFALFACWYLFGIFFGGSTPAPQAAPVVVSSTVGAIPAAPLTKGGPARKLGTTSGQLDPTLHEAAMHATESLLYSGTGRNIFAAGPAETLKPVIKIPKPIATARNTPPPVYRPPVPQTCPPSCPPIGLKFFGTSTSATGERKAFLLQGDDVFLAAVGDVVARRYRVVGISANSIQVEDIPNTNKQNLPLQTR
jgi:hypothetical protein